ncbi:MAG: hypothetical protein JJE39_07665 [Vicinamibacteria bacterium]|nr:hypothetical protein [Vicinamibacteria bacterium]
MPLQNQTTFDQFGQRVSDYMPTLLAGLLVLLAGGVAGWLLKRAIVRLLLMARLDLMGGADSAWRNAIGKGDVRAALYNATGTIFGSVLFLVFVDNALVICGLTVLARLVDRIIFYLPTLGIAVLIAWVGLALSEIVARRVEAVLIQERVPHTALLVGLAKSAFLSVVAALAMWELNFAREIVLAAFLIGFGAIGVAFALGVGIGSARAIQAALTSVIAARTEREPHGEASLKNDSTAGGSHLPSTP